MDRFRSDFNSRLKTALVGTADATLVFVGNFEVEEQWARGEVTLPRVSAGSGVAVVNHMDEFAMLLAGRDDHVVLKARPDEEYLGYLEGLGLTLPTLHVVARQEARRTVTEDVLADPALLRVLSGLATGNRRLAVHGVSTVEEELAARTGLRLAAPAAAVCKAVNSKIYSRRVADDIGLRQPAGWACETLADLREAFSWARPLLADGHRVVVKEAFGVSGKGIAVLRDEGRMDRLYRMIATKVERSGVDRIAFVVEDWVEKSGDLNYQFTIGRDGEVCFDFVKEALTAGGVHMGHRMPAALSGAQVEELADSARQIGKRLATDGYFGVAGVDALIDPTGGLYPVIEINARNNMSTYQVQLQETFVPPGKVALARHYPLRLRRPLGFGTVRGLLGDLVLDSAGGNGLLVNNFATVNAGADPEGDGPFDGRLYGIVVAGSSAELAIIDAGITDRLTSVREDRP
jgi:hypothetical protein